MNKEKIHSRGLTSFFTLFGFLIMSITGLVLYIMPAGRVAYWTDWSLLGLVKIDWDNIHILSSLLFITAGAFHTWLNWKPLMNYFKNKVTSGLKLKRELAISSIISIWVVLSALYPFPPLSYLLDFSTFSKEAWVLEDDYEPPFGHAELVSLKVFSKRMGMDLTAVESELRENNITFANSDQILADIAIANEISPMFLYMMIKKFEPKTALSEGKIYTPEMVDLEFSGTGFGNRSLTTICEKIGVITTNAMDKLQKAGVEIKEDQTLKSAGTDNNLDPIEILKIIMVENYLLVKKKS